MTRHRMTPQEIKQADASYRQWCLSVLTSTLISKPEPASSDRAALRIRSTRRAECRSIMTATEVWIHDTSGIRRKPLAIHLVCAS